MLFSLFALGTLWFWILIIASTIGIVALIENEYIFWADLVFIITLFALYKLGCDKEISTIGSWIIHNPLSTFFIFIGYLIAGTFYSLIKWTLFLVNLKKEYLKNKTTYFFASQWTPGEHKEKIIHWMIYWPISSIWTLMSNPVAKAFNHIFDKFEGIYQRISDRIMNDLTDKTNK